jgi:N-acetylglucosamine-6-phosphate deacetylase
VRRATVIVAGGRIADVMPPDRSLDGASEVALDGGILAPGFVDLQVNGGGGLMLNDAPTVATLETMATAHAGLGATTILPTLITDRPDAIAATIAATAAACAASMPGIAGLHLEGPHLSLARKGAHDPALIRPMGQGDLDMLLEAARRLPCLMVTLAPESATPAQIATLAAAGVIVALGHTDAGYDAIAAAVAAGARVTTHLFNAMSQLGNREPGLVGATLDTGALHAGLIADGIHVHPATIRAALAAKTGPGAIYLVSDAMAPAGSALASFMLNGRRITRADGRLTLDDGTLAGADLDLAQALRVMTGPVGLDVAAAIFMATAVPARVIGRTEIGAIRVGAAADLLHLTDDLQLAGVWRQGSAVSLSPRLRRHSV